MAEPQTSDPQPYRGPTSGYAVVPNDVRFMYSSVQGDYRVLTTAAGMICLWRDVVTGHDADGRQRWRADGMRVALAVSPDGRYAAVLTSKPELAVLDARTGVVLAARAYPDADATVVELGYLPDGSILVSLRNQVRVLDPHLEELSRHDVGDDEFGSYAVLPLAGACAGQVLVSDTTTASQRRRIDARSGDELARVERGPADGQPAWQGLLGTGAVPLLWAPSERQLAICHPETLQPWASASFEGLDGVQNEAQAASARGTAATRWAMRAVASPDGGGVLVIDQGGLLHVLDGRSLAPRRLIGPPALDYPYDVAWSATPGVFWAIVNDGRIARMSVDAAEPEWVTPSVFTDADRERLYRDEAEWRETIDAGKLIVLLDEAAATTSLARYKEIADQIGRGPALTELGAELTPQRVDGLLRGAWWYLPRAGFEEVGELPALAATLSRVDPAAFPDRGDAERFERLRAALEALLRGGDLFLAGAPGDAWYGRFRGLDEIEAARSLVYGCPAAVPGIELGALPRALERLGEIFANTGMHGVRGPVEDAGEALAAAKFALLERLPYVAALDVARDWCGFRADSSRRRVRDALHHHFPGPETDSFLDEYYPVYEVGHDITFGEFPETVDTIETLLEAGFSWGPDGLDVLNRTLGTRLTWADKDAADDLHFDCDHRHRWHATFRDDARFTRVWHFLDQDEVDADDLAEIVRILTERWGAPTYDGAVAVFATQGALVRVRADDDGWIGMTVIPSA